jgi:hypothetical protein
MDKSAFVCAFGPTAGDDAISVFVDFGAGVSVKCDADGVSITADAATWAAIASAASVAAS